MHTYAHLGVWLRSMGHTAELDSVVRCTPQRFLRNLKHLNWRCDALRGADPLVGSPPWSLTPLWEAHRRAWLCGVMQTANRGDWLRRCLTPQWDAYREVFKKIFFMHTSLCGMMHIAESDSSVWCPLWRRTPPYDAHWYPGKIKKEFENILVCLSGSQVGSNHDKNRGKQCRWSLGRMKIFLIISVTPQPNCNCIVKVNTLSLSLRPNLQYPPVALTATFLCKTAFNTQWEK